MEKISPTSLTFITTYKCTSACEDCCFACTPLRNEKISADDMKTIINEAIHSFPTIGVVIFTGGEPFLLKDELLPLIKYIQSTGRLTRIVSNAYWAHNYKTAYLLLILLISRKDYLG